MLFLLSLKHKNKKRKILFFCMFAKYAMGHYTVHCVAWMSLTLLRGHITEAEKGLISCLKGVTFLPVNGLVNSLCSSRFFFMPTIFTLIHIFFTQMSMCHSKTDCQLLRQKSRQKFSVMKTKKNWCFQKNSLFWHFNSLLS